MFKPDGEDGMAPWFLDVLHDHGVEPPQWVGIVYQHAKGQRYPRELKALVEGRREQRRRVLETKRNHQPKVTRCPLHPADKYPEGCPDAPRDADV